MTQYKNAKKQNKYVQSTKKLTSDLKWPLRKKEIWKLWRLLLHKMPGEASQND